MTDHTLIARAQEIIAKSEESITAHEAITQALPERYPTREAMAAAAATALGSLSRQLKTATYHIPESDGLFDIPAVISNNTPDGVLFIKHDDAPLGGVRQWIREGRQYHAAQHLRFQHAGDQVKPIKDVPDEVPWSDARRELEKRTGELEA